MVMFLCVCSVSSLRSNTRRVSDWLDLIKIPCGSCQLTICFFHVEQVRLFISEDSPSQVGSESQDHFQAKSSGAAHLSDDNLPPGFGGLLSPNESIKLSDIPVIKWQCSVQVSLLVALLKALFFFFLPRIIKSLKVQTAIPPLRMAIYFTLNSLYIFLYSSES